VGPTAHQHPPGPPHPPYTQALKVPSPRTVAGMTSTTVTQVGGRWQPTQPWPGQLRIPGALNPRCPQWDTADSPLSAPCISPHSSLGVPSPAITHAGVLHCLAVLQGFGERFPICASDLNKCAHPLGPRCGLDPPQSRSQGCHPRQGANEISTRA
jgi:hypothetical protein